MTDKTACVW